MAIKTMTNVDTNKKRIPLKLDIFTMNTIIGFLYSKSNLANRKAFSNVRRLFQIFDEDIYKTNNKLYSRYKFIINTLEARLDKNFVNNDSIVRYCQSVYNDKDTNKIVKELESYTLISYDEILDLLRSVDDILKFSYLYTYKDKIYQAVEVIDSGDYKSFADINNNLLGVCTDVVNYARKIKSAERTGRLNFADINSVNQVKDIVEKYKDPSRILYTGIKAFNESLSPGFISGKLYTILGLPGGFKSGLLLSIAKDIKMYNQNYKSRTGKKPVVYVVLMENTVEETVERLFNMIGGSGDIRENTPEEVIDILKNQGRFKFGEDKTSIDIVLQYYPNRSIDTQKLYEDIDDLHDEGYEVVSLILDYLKRIRPYERGKDTKEELKNISNELKSIATHYDISVITAHQLNRSGQAAVDDALKANKEDLGRLLGRSNIGDAWEIIENTDVLFIINVERHKETGRYYLTIKRAKIRYKELSDLNYFNHPFSEDSKIRLVVDIELDESVSEISLATNLEGVDMTAKKGKRRATKTEVVDDIFDMDSIA